MDRFSSHSSFRAAMAVVVVFALVTGFVVSAAAAQDGPGAPELPASPESYGPASDSDGRGLVLENDGADSSTDDADSSSEQVDSEFIADFKEFLGSDVDQASTIDLPNTSTTPITVGDLTAGDVLLGLPSEAALNVTGEPLGDAQVVYESSKDLQVEVATVLGDGVRIVTVINGPNAPTTYTYSLTIPEGVRLQIKQGVGNALLIADDENGDEVPVGYINIPWAYDANGDEVPVSQVITETEITFTVDHSNATYPVYADPTYYNIVSCAGGYGRNVYPLSDYIYKSNVCPSLTFYTSKGYWPVGTTYIGPHRTVKMHGDCSWVPETSFTYDHEIPCKAHDYCYDLEREDYTHATKLACDRIFEGDLRISCENYFRLHGIERWESCHLIASFAIIFLRSFTFVSDLWSAATNWDWSGLVSVIWNRATSWTEPPWTLLPWVAPILVPVPPVVPIVVSWLSPWW